MSWLKKIGKKGKGKGQSDADQNGVTDETVLFGSDEPFQPDSPSSRSSMISELAGLDPESSADLSGELNTPSTDKPSLIDQYLQDDPAEQSADISLDFEDDAGQQQTAVFNSDDPSAQLPGFDVSSDQQQTAIFNEPPSGISEPQVGSPADSSPITGHNPQPHDDQAGAPISSAREMPNLEFDSQPEISNPDSPSPVIDEVLSPIVTDSPTAEPFEPSQGDSELFTDGFSGSGSDEFDLDLSEEFPAAEDSAPQDARSVDWNSTGENFSGTDVTGEQSAVETINPEQSVDYEQLATVKIDQSVPVPAPVVAETGAVKPAHPETDFDGDATVITTASGAPANALDAHFVVGWVIVVDGPGKGHSLPVRSGINSIGRSPEQAIPLYFGDKSDGEVSRRDHTRIIYDPRTNSFKLQHGSSRNLSYHNDEPILEIIDLKPYDRIGIGKTTLLFVPLCGNMFRW